jgi:hypothetical protein
MTDLVGRTTRGIFRDLMTDSTVGAINTTFQDEGFAPNPDCRYEDSSARRQTTQSYLDKPSGIASGGRVSAGWQVRDRGYVTGLAV